MAKSSSVANFTPDKLYFSYSAMNAGKSTILLQAAYNYRERGMEPFLITAKLDNRAGYSKIVSRIGIEEKAHLFDGIGVQLADGSDGRMTQHCSTPCCAGGAR